MAYSKLYSSIVQSSLWNESDHVRLLFITLLALADREGFVLGSRHGLVRVANIDPDACEEYDPFVTLMSPDKDSSDRMRNPENEGRRIEEVPGGFRILNYLYYRGLRNEDDRREQNKLAQRRHRSRISGPNTEEKSKPKSALSSHGEPPSSYAEAEAEAEYKESTQSTKINGTPIQTVLLGEGMGEPPIQRSRSAPRRRSAPPDEPSDDFLEFWEEYPRRKAQKDAWKAWKQNPPPLELCLEALKKAKKTPDWNRGKEFIPYPATWLRGERWDDES